MKKSFLGLAIILFAFTSCKNKSESNQTEKIELNGPIAINLDSSSITWQGDMLNMFSHNGTVDLKSADLVAENGVITSGKFVIDLTSINPLDSNYTAEHPKENLVGHLSSDDFLNVENYPTSTFVIKTATNNQITGDLTIRDKTNTEKIENVAITKENGKTVITGDIVFDRSKYDIKFVAPGDKVLSNDITINVKLVANN